MPIRGGSSCQSTVGSTCQHQGDTKLNTHMLEELSLQEPPDSTAAWDAFHGLLAAPKLRVATPVQRMAYDFGAGKARSRATNSTGLTQT